MATSYTITVDRGAATRSAGEEAFRIVTNTTRRVYNRANILTPVRHGRLRAGNRWRVQKFPTRAVGEVFNDTAYAAAVHDGSRAHTIVPRRRKVLRFQVGTETVFATRVRIPARKGRPWLEDALKQVAGPEGYALSQ